MSQPIVMPKKASAPLRIVAHVTKDAKKLWRCSVVPRTHGEKHRGELPPSAGYPISLYLPERCSMPHGCQARQFWWIAVDATGKEYPPETWWVCSHQVDVDL